MVKTAVSSSLNTRQDDRHFPDDIFKYILLNENMRLSIKTSLKFVPKGPIDNILALAHMMAWSRPGDNPLSEPVMFSLLTQKCVIRPHWVNAIYWPQFVQFNCSPCTYFPHIYYTCITCGTKILKYTWGTVALYELRSINGIDCHDEMTRYYYFTADPEDKIYLYPGCYLITWLTKTGWVIKCQDMQTLSS